MAGGSCPISGGQRDNNVARIVAAQVLILAVVTLITAFSLSVRAALVIDALLALDFIVRAFAEPRFSPLAAAGRGIASVLKLKPAIVDSAPKIFAARIGVAFTAAAGIFLALSLVPAGGIVLGILAVCAFLESLFGFCLGCRIYSLLPEKIAGFLVPPRKPEKTPAVPSRIEP
jgi:hypothetical protein